MKYYQKIFLAGLILLSLHAFDSKAAPNFTITEINPGYFNDPNVSVSYNDLNNKGQITGEYSNSLGPLRPHGFLYTMGKTPHLVEFGGTVSIASAVNNKGEVTGLILDENYSQHAFIYSKGQTKHITSNPSDFSWGLDINDKGQVTGYSVNGVFLYSNGQFKDTGIFGTGNGINDQGDIAGELYEERHAFFYHDGQLTDLGTLGGDYSSANKINNNGQITGGASMDDGSSHAFLYNDGQMTDLGILPGFTYSEGVDINAQGQVVGFNGDRNYNTQAFLYSDDKMIDLNTLVEANSGWDFYKASAINDLGQILASGKNSDGQYGTVLLTPVTVPLPAAAWLFGSALTGLGIIQRKLLKKDM